MSLEVVCWSGGAQSGVDGGCVHLGHTSAFCSHVWVTLGQAKLRSISLGLGFLPLTGNGKLGMRNYGTRSLQEAQPRAGCKMWKGLGVSLCLKSPAPPASSLSAERSVFFHFPA